MNVELKTLSLPQAAQFPADALLVLLPDESKGADALLKPAQQAAAAGHFEAGVGKLLSSYGVPGVQAARVTWVRCGKGDAAAVRKAVAAAAGALKGSGIAHLAVVASLLSLDDDGLAALIQAVAEASYVFTTTKPSAKPRALRKLSVGVRDAAALKQGLRLGRALVAGVEFAKEWANRPANHATPTLLGEAARKLGRGGAIRTEVLGPRQVEALGMGAFMAVAQGSAQPLRFIVMHYDGAAKREAPVVLVGKGISFDTGGISLKPAPEMDEMKFDMGGAASVLGTFAALAELRPAINVVGLIPSCENMPDGMAVKPGDVVTSMSGQTIEILNTDAEGRLILCDALTYAARFKPRAVIDIATLTGACVIALGAVRSGLFSADDGLAGDLQRAGEASGDLCWRMPLDDEYAEGLKSNFADMGNVAGRAAGAVTAAKFLQKFTAELRWAHLDIAGTAWKSGAAKGATGRPVPLLLRYLADEAARPQAAAPSPRRKARKAS